jgi:hypothetical protein
MENCSFPKNSNGERKRFLIASKRLKGFLLLLIYFESNILVRRLIDAIELLNFHFLECVSKTSLICFNSELLGNTSTQAFFLPDPEDADLIRATLSSTARYGATTRDLPSLHCWLRARLSGQWQPPTQARVEPLARAKHTRVQELIWQVIEAHPADYVPAEDWQKRGVLALSERLPPSSRALLDEALKEKSLKTSQLGVEREQAYDEDHRRLGFQ